jgi:hypothetical protein
MSMACRWDSVGTESNTDAPCLLHFDISVPACCMRMGCDCRNSKGSWGRHSSVVLGMCAASHSSCLALGGDSNGLCMYAQVAVTAEHIHYTAAGSRADP